MRRLLFLFSVVILAASLQAQPTEFTKGWTTHFRIHNGAVTTFSSAPDLYIAGLQVVPQVTLAEGAVRGGLIGGGFFTNKRIYGIAGPTISFLLKTFRASELGSAGNLHVSFDHLWGTDRQTLLGGGLHIDLLNKLTLGVTAHRDYKLNNWWLQTALGIRISKIKRTPQPFNQ